MSIASINILINVNVRIDVLGSQLFLCALHLKKRERENDKMAKNNDVGLIQLKNGNWAYRVAIYKDGKKKDTTCRRDENGNPFPTKREAKRARELRLAEIRTTVELKKSIPQKTLGDVWKEYLEKDAKNKASATVRKYSSLWRIHVNAEFGSKLINDITIADLQNFLATLYDSGLSFSYVESFLKLFYMLFGIAYRNEWIETDKYTRMFIDKGTKLQMPKMSQDDLEELEDVKIYELYEIHQIEEIFKGGNCYTAFLLGYYLGLRISECFGLMWSDYNWDTHVMRVNKQMVYEDGFFCLKPVKTLTSVRYIDVPDIVHNYLVQENRKQMRHPSRAYLAKKTEVVLDRTKKNTEKEIVGGDFINRKDNGELLTINSMKYWTKEIKAKTGIDFKYHSLRKTHLTQLAAMNTPVIEVMKRAGHKKYETTMKYYINKNLETKRLLLNNLSNLSTEEPEVEILEPDGTKRVVKQSVFFKMKKISAIIPH